LDDELTLHEVAAELGVHYMTAYRYVRLGILPARREGREWRVRRADLKATEAEHERPSDAGARWDERVFNRLIDGDESGAWWVIESALASGSTPEQIILDVLAPALAAVGGRWGEGTLGIDQEHIASTVATRLLGRLGARFARRGSDRGVVLIGGTESELHGLPLSLAAQLVRLAGYEVIDLGPRIPPSAFASAAGRAERLVAVAVGVTTSGLDDEVRHTVGELRRSVDVPIIVGGAGVPSREAALSLGADGWAATGAELVELIEGPAR
jgi:excisionase family DNA binding protein